MWQTSGFTQQLVELICSGTEKGHVQNRANNPKSEPGEGHASTTALSIQLEKWKIGTGLQRIAKILEEGLCWLLNGTWAVSSTFTEAYV